MSGVSESGEFPTIERVFELLDDWRHLPTYQLERRADIFFALFLPEVLGKHFGIDINPILIPEFPIKNREDNTSKKVDYLALQKSPDGKSAQQAFLVELKTDVKSIKRDQISVLEDAACKGINEIIEDLKSIAMSESVKGSPQTRGKYFHLFRALEKTTLIEIPNGDELEKLLPSGKLKTDLYKEYVREIEIKECPRLEIVYILPEKSKNFPYNNVRQIYFKEFLEYANNQGGAIGNRFAESLKRWEKQAGLCLPQ